MNGLPFGFNPSDPDDQEPGQPGAFDIAGLGAALSQLGSMLQGMGSTGPSNSPVNWDSALDVARRSVSSGGDPAVGEAARRRTSEAVRLAELWMDSATTLPCTGAAARAWSRSEWLTQTMPAWRSVIEPVAEHVLSAMTGMLPNAEELKGALPPELAAMLPAGMSQSDLAGMLLPMMGMAKQMGANMFAMQVGQALSALASDVLSAGDVGLPLTSDGVATLLPANIEQFGRGLGIDPSDVEIYIALREVAHQRLFTHVPWLGPRVIGAVEQYASGIGLDTSKMEELIRGIDPSKPADLSEAMASGLLVPEDTPQQKAALARLETLLALTEGWVDHVVTAAVADRLASVTRLQEAVRRRRAAGGPAEKTFATLVGLELRPRRLREAATLWQELDSAVGMSGRDDMWQHPDLLPGPQDLDNPRDFVAGMSGSSSFTDADLAALVAGTVATGGTGEAPAADADVEPAGHPQDGSGTDHSGTDHSGTEHSGTEQTGSDETGSDETGSDDDARGDNAGDTLR